MSLQPQATEPVPEETARVVRAAFPKQHPYLLLRDTLGTLFQDADFAPLFPSRGQPALAPWRLALVTLLQFAEGLSDRQAAEAVRARLDWKYLLGLELTDPGFDYSVLCEFRTRLLEGQAETLLLTTLLRVCQERKWLQAGGRQRSDTTHVLAAIRTLNRLELVGETLRHALDTLAIAAPEWLRAHLQPEWVERYGTRFEETRLPKGEAARQALAQQIGRDGYHLGQLLYAPEAPTWLRELPAVEVLRQVWLTQYYSAEQPVWRAPADQPPAGARINSPYDPEAAFAQKRDTTWIGYKVCLTESCDPEGVHLITRVETVPAATEDSELTVPLHEGLAADGLLPREHFLDAGFMTVETLVELRETRGVRLIGPVLGNESWQARQAGGFEQSAFQIDWEARQVTCPGGHQNTRWQETRGRTGAPLIVVKFAQAACAGCASRERCTRASRQGRSLTLQPEAYYQALQAARAEQRTPDWKAEYRARAGVEGTISQGTRGFELRRCRYLGLAKTHLQHLATAAAMNLARLAAWFAGVPHARTRITPFTRLATAL
jgi:transposase